MEKVDSSEGKYFQVNAHTFFLGPTNSILHDSLADLLRKEFNSHPIHLEELAKKRFSFQRKGMEAIARAETYTRKWLDREGLTEEDIGGPNFWKTDFYLCGIDLLGRPYLIDFREGFTFQIYATPGTFAALKHISQIDQFVGRKIKDLRFIMGNPLLNRLPRGFLKEFQKRVIASAFPGIIRYIAKKDFRVGEVCDIISIDRNGSEILRPRKNLWTD